MLYITSITTKNQNVNPIVVEKDIFFMSNLKMKDIKPSEKFPKRLKTARAIREWNQGELSRENRATY